MFEERIVEEPTCPDTTLSKPDSITGSPTNLQASTIRPSNLQITWTGPDAPNIVEYEVRTEMTPARAAYNAYFNDLAQHSDTSLGFYTGAANTIYELGCLTAEGFTAPGYFHPTREISKKQAAAWFVYAFKEYVTLTQNFTNDTPDTNSIQWTSHVIQYKGTSYNIVNGNTSNTWVWWVRGATSYTTGNSLPATTAAENIIVIAKNVSGTATKFPASAYFNDLSQDAFTHSVNRIYELGMDWGWQSQFFPDTALSRWAMAIWLCGLLNETASAMPYDYYFTDWCRR